ncbi:hypothetical protein LN42_01460 [Marinitoga sp. 1137]|uniref:DUF2202 domain-containing protein n=1 Tax=Marinitoga sp. 1137 TaxID=1545835 RepID=UPI0009506712|nr:DUF2202 domain-containing protein [Marinitoga sp. 1137]APT75206.1 hypothetical protein LN42_01460 [Marinitoga sp. 1137]
MRKLLFIYLVIILLSLTIFGEGFFDNPSESIQSLPYQTLSATEISGLLQMREEEKLARDVYLSLYYKWNIETFYNISKSEQTHMDAVKAILDKYNLEDPVKDNTVGVFTNTKLQKLYYDLVAMGMPSEVDALKVGGFIEDLDIYDLDELLKETDNEDIILVYENLRKGSENHMRAFVSQLEKYNETYTPKFITLDEFNKILSDSNSMGNGNGHGKK